MVFLFLNNWIFFINFRVLRFILKPWNQRSEKSSNSPRGWNVYPPSNLYTRPLRTSTYLFFHSIICTCGSIEDTSLLVIQLRKQTKNPDWTFTKRKALLEPHILNLGNPIATQTLIWVFVKYGWSPLSPLLWAVVRSEVTIFFEEFRA